MRTVLHRTCSALLPWFALAFAAAAQADVHKCVNAAEQVSFQDQACPEGSEDTVVRVAAPSHAPPPDTAPASAPPPAAPVAARARPAPAADVPNMWLCTRPEDNSQYMSRDGVTPPRMVPAGVLGVTNKSLNDAYSGPNGVGVSAPGVRPIPVDHSPAGSIASGYVAVQDSCQPASREQVCGYLEKQYDRVREKLRRAFKDERAVLEPQQAELEQQMGGCG
jgi:hypothetical protein